AQNIIEYRNKNGLFRKKEELKNVTGIGEKKYEEIKQSISI
ncbi:MAG: helix-hairpin-helix domain-containing protein, partial [Actinobacteria bacterium]|nr:helix-hairpin-helix domain-containing protein [Actinomycetota bacterium]